MAYKVVLDAGHGGYDNGATYGDHIEKNDNLNLTLAIGEILEANGVDVIYTRVDDVYISPLRRAQIANAAGADLFVSIHRNSGPVPNTYNGVQTLIYDEGGLKQIAAENINRELENVGFTNIGVEIRNNLAVLRRTQMPSLLVEVGFINTDADNAIFVGKFPDVANAIASGILETINNNNETTNTNATMYRVQVGLFRNLSNAQNLQYNLSQMGYTVYIVRQGEYYAVQIGDLPTMDQAIALEQTLKQLGYSTLIVTV